MQMNSPPSQGVSGSPLDSESEADVQIESLVSGRAKRATAGQRLSLLVTKEQDDDIELLFAEDEQEADDSFDEDEEDASDVNLGSSSDEEDAEAAKGDEDLAGEKELQQQARQEMKKRKAQVKARVPGLAKRVKIDPTAMKAPSQPQMLPTKRKKSERVSWVASAADAPTRISSRKQTVQNRETVHQRLVDGEKQRRKVMQQMEEAQKRKEARKPKALTQSQRLEEAAKIEKKNAKSLTRWEESEKERLVEQKAKLEALHNRQLSGPVVTLWSGLTRWLDNKIVAVGVEAVRDSGHIEDSEKMMESLRLSVNTVAHMDSPTNTSNRVIGDHTPQAEPPSYPSQHQTPPVASQPNFLAGIHAYAALPFQRGAPSSSASIGTPIDQTTNREVGAANKVQWSDTQPQGSEKEYQSRNLIALRNIDANAQRLPEWQLDLLLKKQKTKPISKPHST